METKTKLYATGVTRNPFNCNKVTCMEYISSSDLEDMDIDLAKRAKFCLPSWIMLTHTHSHCCIRFEERSRNAGGNLETMTGVGLAR
jgi:hypothetical protein